MRDGPPAGPLEKTPSSAPPATSCAKLTLDETSRRRKLKDAPWFELRVYEGFLIKDAKEETVQ